MKIPSLTEVIYKKDLAIGLGMEINSRTFTKELTRLEPRIKEISPDYNKNHRRLSPKEACFIIEQLGYDKEEFIENYKKNIHPGK